MLAIAASEIVGLIVSLVVVSAALVVVAHYSPPHVVTLAVALLTVAMLAAWVASPQRAESLVPLIGVGVGALATALTAVFSDDKRRPPKE
jgi:ABC-type enterochelin transport system permease subunit